MIPFGQRGPVQSRGTSLDATPRTVTRKGGSGPTTIATADFTSLASSGGVFTAPPPWLSLTCATSGTTVQTSASSLASGLAANAWRARSIGTTTGLAVEKAATNQLPSPFNFGHGAWSFAPTVTVATGQADPAGGTQALLYTSSGAGTDYGDYDSLSPGSGTWSMSGWAKPSSGSGTISKLVFYDMTLVGQYATLASGSNTWRRMSVPSYSPTLANNPVYLGFDQRALPTGAPITTGVGSWYVYGAQLEGGSYPTSLISGARAVTTLSTTTTVAPSGRVNVTTNFAPNFASGEAVSAEPIVWWSAGNQVALTATGTVQVTVGGSVVLTTGALTWSRDQVITVALHLAPSGALSVTVSGATTGNGTTSATGVAAFTTTATTYLFGSSAGAAESVDLKSITFFTP